MAITTVSGLQTAAVQRLRFRKTTTIGNALRVPWGYLSIAGDPAAGSLSVGNTTTGVVPTSATAGFPPIRAFGAGNVGYIAEARLVTSVLGGAYVYDRLYHVGSVSLTSLATTTLSSQPSFAARVPSTDYSACEIWGEIAAASSNTATTVEITYTNEAGTSGRTTGAVSVQNMAAGRQVEFALQAGDKGVQTIESIIVGGTVATSGTFNAWVGRRLVDLDIRVDNGQDWQGPDMTGLPVIYDSSALHFLTIPESTNGGRIGVSLVVVNG